MPEAARARTGTRAHAGVRARRAMVRAATEHSSPDRSGTMVGPTKAPAGGARVSRSFQDSTAPMTSP